VLQRWYIAQFTLAKLHRITPQETFPHPNTLLRLQFSTEYLTLLTPTIFCGFLVSITVQLPGYIPPPIFTSDHATDNLSYIYYMTCAMYQCLQVMFNFLSVPTQWPGCLIRVVAVFVLLLLLIVLRGRKEIVAWQGNVFAFQNVMSVT